MDNVNDIFSRPPIVKKIAYYRASMRINHIFMRMCDNYAGKQAKVEYHADFRAIRDLVRSVLLSFEE